MMEMSMLRQNIEMQLAEVELLQSMYPQEQEFKLNNVTMLEDLREWLENDETASPESSISFVLKLNNVQMFVQFPYDYPSKKCAEIFVRSNELTRDNQSKLNKDILDFLNEAFEAECAITSEAICWLQEHICEYSEVMEQSCSEIEHIDGPVNFGRLWLYSHHIYSKTKRKNILDLAKDNKLTGFCMPGKPGIVCLEGILDICNDVWCIIKQWNWKQINVKFQEDHHDEGISQENMENFRKFDKFEEIGFVKGDTRDYHMDMGEFFKYLQNHNCEYMFKELFGIDKS